MATEPPADPPRPLSPFHDPDAPGKGSCKAQQVHPRMERLLPGEPVAFDAEFQTVKRHGADKWKQRLGWVAVVNTKEESILDVFVAYDREKGARKAYPPSRFGVGMEDLLFSNGAVNSQTVEAWLKDIFKDRPVVMHDTRGDMGAFEHEKPFESATVYDTQQMYPGRQGLADLSSEYLGRIVQDEGVHTPTEDATATMQLFLQVRPYDRAAEKAKLKAQGVPTTSGPVFQEVPRVHSHYHQQRNPNTGKGKGNTPRIMQQRPSNAPRAGHDQSWAGEAFIRPAKRSQRHGKGAKKNGNDE